MEKEKRVKKRGKVIVQEEIEKKKRKRKGKKKRKKEKGMGNPEKRGNKTYTDKREGILKIIKTKALAQLREKLPGRKMKKIHKTKNHKKKTDLETGKKKSFSRFFFAFLFRVS